MWSSDLANDGWQDAILTRLDPVVKRAVIIRGNTNSKSLSDDGRDSRCECYGYRPCTCDDYCACECKCVSD